jgi:Ca-activated chloride channel homolog
MPLKRILRAAPFILVVFLGLFACGLFPSGDRLTVMAGSELKDLEPLFDDIRRETGIGLEMSYTGTLDGAERLLAGEEVDLAWFSHAKYLLLLEGASGRVLGQEKIMLSPVVLGVKQSKAESWGWVDNPDLTWLDVIERVNTGELRYAMTNPASSNSGFTVLVGAAAALSGSADALQTEDIDAVSADLRSFFQGQALTSGSSGWLAEQYVLEQERLDGLVNYESVLLAMNKSGELKEELYLIYPAEGIITADYPLLLINPDRREAYQELVTYLRSTEFQQKMMDLTLRRPVNSQVNLSDEFPTRLLIELPFPSNKEVIDQLLFAYLDEQSIPSHSYFVLDVSGSMEGERLADLKAAINNLTGEDLSLTGQFARFRDRERITILTFNHQITAINEFAIDLSDPDSLKQIANYVNTLEAQGNTAIYSALEEAYKRAMDTQAQDPDRYYSIVLMSDGENTTGNSKGEFRSFYNRESVERNIKTFTILFGDADERSMEDIAEITGGRMFNAQAESLSQVFKQIRGYQ